MDANRIRCFVGEHLLFPSEMKRSIQGEERGRRGGGWLSTIIIGAIVALLCRLRYGDYLFEQQVVLKTAINRRRLQFTSVERFFLPLSSYLSRARKRKLIIGSPIIHHLRIGWMERRAIGLSKILNHSKIKKKTIRREWENK